MSCRFAGGADSPEAFAKLLEQGESLISEIPLSRFDINEYYDKDPRRSW